MTAKARTARTARTVTPATEAPAEAPVATTDEAPVQPDATPATEATVPAGPTVIDISGIKFDVRMTDDLIRAYGAASSGDKTKIRNAIQTAMMAAVMAADLPSAQALGAAQEALKAVSAPKAEIDYTQVVIDRAIGLAYAAKRLGYGDVLPEGIDQASVDKARVEEAFRAYMSGDMDAVTDAQAAVAKVATAKITRTTVRGSVEAHIETAFEGLAVGTVLTVAQIRTRSGAASDGAIAARLWPVDAKTKAPKECTLDLTALGVELTTSDTGSRAVRKVR